MPYSSFAIIHIQNLSNVQPVSEEDFSATLELIKRKDLYQSHINALNAASDARKGALRHQLRKATFILSANALRTRRFCKYLRDTKFADEKAKLDWVRHQLPFFAFGATNGNATKLYALIEKAEAILVCPGKNPDEKGRRQKKMEKRAEVQMKKLEGGEDMEMKTVEEEVEGSRGAGGLLGEVNTDESVGMSSGGNLSEKLDVASGAEEE